MSPPWVGKSMDRKRNARRAKNSAAGFLFGKLPTGTPVSVTSDIGEARETLTRSEPWQLGDGTWVVLVDGLAGGVALERVVPLKGGPR